MLVKLEKSIKTVEIYEQRSIRREFQAFVCFMVGRWRWSREEFLKLILIAWVNKMRKEIRDSRREWKNCEIFKILEENHFKLLVENLVSLKYTKKWFLAFKSDEIIWFRSGLSSPWSEPLQSVKSNHNINYSIIHLFIAWFIAFFHAFFIRKLMFVKLWINFIDFRMNLTTEG